MKFLSFSYHPKNRKHGFTSGMAVFILVFTVLTASMPCQKKNICRPDNVPGAKTCAGDSKHRHLHICQLKKNVALLTDSSSSRTEKKQKRSHPQTGSFLLLHHYGGLPNRTSFRMALHDGKMPGHSPVIILLTCSFLC